MIGAVRITIQVVAEGGGVLPPDLFAGLAGTTLYYGAGGVLRVVEAQVLPGGTVGLLRGELPEQAVPALN